MKISAAQRLRDLLENDIMNGDLAPGDRLDPEALAVRFGVSRTPVREAIQQLCVTGLVKVTPKKGSFVVRIGIEKLVEMFEVMAELEGMCARLAARRIKLTELDALKASYKACEAAAEGGDTDNYYYENERFHQTIYSASQNSFLIGETQQLKQRLKPYRRLQLQVRQRMQASLDEHRGILDAIEGGNPAGAERAARAHVLIQGEQFSDFAASVKRLHSGSGESPTSDSTS